MSLPDSYTQKPSAIPGYFDAFKNAEVPERFSYKLLENLGFTSTNDRMIIGVIKELGFSDTDGKPTNRYYRFLDKSESAKVIAEGIREAYSDLFSVNTKANTLPVEDLKNKLKSLYAGKKTDQVISRIAATFQSLCEIADFSESTKVKDETPIPPKEETPPMPEERKKDIRVSSLQYHINIVLPLTKDQAIYDAIFKTLKDHLG